MKAGVRKAVDGVDSGSGAGQTFGLVGESGCGKSTLAMLLVKLLEPTAGRIGFDGQRPGRDRRAALREFRRAVRWSSRTPTARSIRGRRSRAR